MAEEEVLDPPADPPADPPVDPPADPPTDDWRAVIKDDKIKEHAGRYTDIESLAKNNFEMRQKLSDNVGVPGKDASDDEISAYRKAIGMPESLEKYELTAPEGTDEDMQDFWKKTFYENDIPPTKAAKLQEATEGLITKLKEREVEADKAFAKATDDALREEWKGDEYKRNMEFGKRAFKEIFAENIEDVTKMEMKDGRFLMDHPLLVKGFAKLGREMGEGQLGSVVTESDIKSLTEAADEARANRDKASAKGDYKQAQRYDAEEREILGRIPAKTA